MELSDGLVQLLQQQAAFGRDLHPHDPPVGTPAMARHQAARFEAIHQPRDVRIAGDQAVREFSAGEPGLVRISQTVEDAVLAERQPERL